MKRNKIIAGVLTGIAAGVVISLLVGTEKGRKTGKDLLKKSSGITDDLKGKFGDFIDQIQEKVQGILK